MTQASQCVPPVSRGIFGYFDYIVTVAAFEVHFSETKRKLVAVGSFFAGCLHCLRILLDLTLLGPLSSQYYSSWLVG